MIDYNLLPYKLYKDNLSDSSIYILAEIDGKAEQSKMPSLDEFKALVYAERPETECGCGPQAKCC